MNTTEKITALLIHGYHLGATNWEELVWGNPEHGVYGSAARGAHIAVTERPEYILWSTGASEYQGRTEAQYTYDYAMERLEEVCPGFYEDGVDRYGTLEFFAKRSRFDNKSQNTRQAVVHAIDFCGLHGVGRLLIVGAPTHARGLLEADAYRLTKPLPGIEVWETSSDVPFAGSTPLDVLVVEPPHRGDRPTVPIHKTLREAMRLGRGEHADGFHTALRELIQEWQRK
jgi:hypothetical protein